MKQRTTTIFLLAGFIGLFFSCIHKKEVEKTTVIGKIINPKKTEIVISQDPFNISSDTLYITEGNKFNGKIQLKKEGLHYIFIFPEFQIIYLKPGDSLAFVLNTTEFDESFSFSGSSGFENNLLIELFLANEKENMSISRRMNQMSPDELSKNLDSFYQIKQDLINSYKKAYKKTSRRFRKTIELYNKVAQYRIKENYIRQKCADTIPDSFTEYRSLLEKPVIDANLPDLLYFAKTYIDNEIREKKISRKEVPAASITFINNKIRDDVLRDNILMIYCKNYVIEEKISDDKDPLFQKFIRNIRNRDYVLACKKFIIKNKKLNKGQYFPDIKIRDTHNKTKMLSEILKNGKNLLSYWDIYYKKNFTSNIKKFKALKKQYPDLQIIILNDNPDDFDEWRLQIPQNNDFKFYQLQVPHYKMEQLLPYGLNQVFLLDSSKIKHNLINLYDAQFQKTVNAFMKSEKL